MVRSNNRLWRRVRWLGVNLCRMLLSLTFILSGIVKLIDPVGTQYKIEDYAQAFGLSTLLPGFVPLL
ncbi:MAG: DoxX family protein, partial [Bacteroidaceae bacterium]|nr:DoxX family protein [Bacteroidaceae bacterium]